MCGLLFTNDSSTDEDRLSAALDLMKHRGPDVPGSTQRVAGAWLGHHRLKILDLESRSNQPFRSRSGNHVIVYNGEIYNYRELASRHRIQTVTTSDTEVIVELYEKLGPSFVTELNGMFAFVIVDTRSGDWFAARDRLGIKPLYSTERSDGSVYLSSEIAPLLELGLGGPIDEIGLRQYLKLRTFFNGRTLYSGISMFPAGHSAQNGVLSRYWTLDRAPKQPPGDQELRELVESAVEYRCIADVPVGSYLSGGVDSSIVAAVSQKPDTWTVGFGDANEFDWAELAADFIGSNHTEVIVDDSEFLSAATWLAQHRREPLSVPNEVLLYLMSRRVKTRNTVVLSGEGADELFFGYDRIFRWAAADTNWDLAGFDRHYSYGDHDDREIVEDAVTPFLDPSDRLGTVAAFFQIAHLHGLLRRLDNSTMRCAVEARVPFVDHRLVDRLAGTPYQYRHEGGIPKAPLKRTFADSIPGEIMFRTKVGFPVPIERLFGTGNGNSESPYRGWLMFNLEVLDQTDNLGLIEAATDVLHTRGREIA